jgi:hypothetical protein
VPAHEKTRPAGIGPGLLQELVAGGRWARAETRRLPRPTRYTPRRTQPDPLPVLRTIPLFLALAFAPAPAAPERPRPGDGQLGAPLEFVPVPDSDGEVWRAQRTTDGRLLLTPDESFFPHLGLRATGEGPVEDPEGLNGGRSFLRIEAWDAGEAAAWGVLLERTGALRVRVFGEATSATGRLNVTLADALTDARQEEGFLVETHATTGAPEFLGEAVFTVATPGARCLTVTCEAACEGLALAWLELSGEAAEGGAVLRQRWRPAAAHATLWSSAEPEAVRTWVLELDAAPGERGFYAPITTPFGYYGPTWNADGTVGAGLNFSMWSYGRSAEEPPIEELSHLLAVGDRRADFGDFGHEGTGVKPRGWSPFEGVSLQRVVLALRVEPRDDEHPWDRYTGWFWDEAAALWRLYAAGHVRPKHRPLRSLGVGTFVEVPGTPMAQRTGVTPRRLRYRGWVREEGGPWLPLDRLSAGRGDSDDGLTPTDRGVTGDGRFFLQAGGWTLRPALAGDVALPPREEPPPAWLAPSATAAFDALSATVEVLEARRIEGRVEGRLRLTGAGSAPRITLHWGTTEALTFAERWEHVREVPVPPAADDAEATEVPFVLEGVPAAGQLLLRALLEGDAGRTWSLATTAVAD